MTKEWKLFICAGCVICAVWLASFVLVCLCIDDWNVRGQFGDLFGAVNTLFSGLAFVGLIITIRQQHKDLEYQRQAIEQTNREMQNQTEEFNQQNETMKIERFENTFFKMLEVQQSIVNDLYAADSHTEWIKQEDPNGPGRISKEILTKDEYRGRNLFYYVFKRCEHEIGNHIFPGSSMRPGLYSVIKFRGKDCFDDYMTTTMFDHYFRHLYSILKFISLNEWLGKEKQYQYATFVRATLSRYELVMLYYNGFFHPKMKKMIERYCLLNNIRTDLLPMSLEYRNFLESINKTRENLSDVHFSVGDFEFYLTDDENDNTRYHLSAFYTNKEIKQGINLLYRWRQFVKS